MLRASDPKKIIPPLHGALLKNEQDVHLFEQLVFLQPPSAASLRRAMLVQLLLRAAPARRAGHDHGVSDAARGAARAGRAGFPREDFYYLARTCLVKDERHYDRFDRVFAEIFEGAEKLFAQLMERGAGGWLQALAERTLSRRGKAQRRSARRLGEAARDAARAPARSRRSGTRAATSGSAPAAPRRSAPTATTPKASASARRARAIARAVKVWDQREYRNFDDTVELGHPQHEDGAAQAAQVRARGRPRPARSRRHDRCHRAQRRPAGSQARAPSGATPSRCCCSSMWAARWTITCASARSCSPRRAASSSISSHFYFHNFLYEHVWKDNRRRRFERRRRRPEVLRTYARDYRVIFVGDATMSPYEILQPGGSVEHWNEEAGAVWMQRLCDTFPRLVWLNPEPVERWEYTSSVRITRELIGDRMFPVTMAGLERAIAELRRPLTRAAQLPYPAAPASPEVPQY